VTQSTTLGGNLGGSIAKADVDGAVDAYVKFHDTDGGDVEKRKGMYADMVNKYYDLSTSFYEYGWGESFHFAHRRHNETLRESIRRHEHYLALKLGLKAGMKVLDVGCGVGGPAREIATFSGCDVTGLNNNAYQVTRANAITAQRGLSEQLNFVKGDFMKLPFEAETFDAAYQIEATVHAPDPVGCYRNIFKALKPGGAFAGYEWCVSDDFDTSNPDHVKAKAEIELGNGLPDMLTCSACKAALEEAGFVVEYAEDLAPTAEVAWWEPLSPSSLKMLLQNPSSFKSTKLGGYITRYLVMGLEAAGLAPKGSVKVSQFLEKGADGLIAGGKQGTFTPMYCYVARKPLK
jgi:sterol 24-C-methyltransferase